MTGSSEVGTLSNAGSIDFKAPAGSFTPKTLSVGSLVGSDGLITLNTRLGDSSSVTDKIVINGGAASGTTRLAIRNIGGLGDATTGNGIEVVGTLNHAITATDAFKLNAPVLAGAYEYTLRRNSGNQNWFLSTNSGEPSTPTAPPIPETPIEPMRPLTPSEPSTPIGSDAPAIAVGESKPNYRAETSLYASLPSSILDYNNTLISTLHERRGAWASDVLVDEEPVWMRVIGRHSEHESSSEYRGNLHALQLGADLYGRNDSDGLDRAGVYFVLGQSTASVERSQGEVGDTTVTGESVGAYWTHVAPVGWYLDSVAQLTWNKAQAKSTNDLTLKTQGLDKALSLEAGYPLQVGNAIIVEPQAQVVLQQMDMANTHDAAADVSFKDVESLRARAGVRIAKKWANSGKAPLTLWIRPNIEQEFAGNPATSFSTLTQGNIDFGSSQHGSTFKLDAGVQGQLSKSISLITHASYDIGLKDNASGYGFSVDVGLNARF
jgi:outer membrane autotransporter protein